MPEKYVTIKIKESVYKKLLKLISELQEERGRKVSFSKAIEYLFERIEEILKTEY